MLTKSKILSAITPALSLKILLMKQDKSIIFLLLMYVLNLLNVVMMNRLCFLINFKLEIHTFTKYFLDSRTYIVQ